MTANQETRTRTPSTPPVRERTSDVFSYPPSASPFDQNGKLWESIMPGPKPALHSIVRRKVGALSDSLFQLPVAGRLSTLAERLPGAVPGWRRLGYASQWLILTVGGMALAFTLTWTLSRGSSRNTASATAVTHAAMNAPVQAAQTSHALQPSAPVHAVPVAVSTPEPEATRIPAPSLTNGNEGVVASSELEPSDKPLAKTKSARAKKKLARAKTRASRTTRTRARTASR
jgi:hypothetical protein